ncbi:endonuclease/exonuclease/phosphatase family protein [Methanolobus sp. ZRKC5]|uniref:endonuclease/exonuclease/phosphatase family protein n=1 Tax=unclassified Methanolobus TaxID=2629569 RepID=UPI00313AF761
MNIITWNCKMAFRNHYNKLLSECPDLLVIPECENLDYFKDKFYHHALWIGDNDKKGLGVFSFNNIEIKVHEAYNKEYKYVLPVKIKVHNNPNTINLIAIWSQNNKVDPKRRYIGEVWNALNYYKDLLDQSLIIAGDFNWDFNIKQGSSLYGTFNDVTNLLNKHNIFSAYHVFNNLKFGDEIVQTFFQHHKIEKGHHTDYIFASNDLMKSMESFSVGEHKDWYEISDHVPLVMRLK